MTPTAVDYLIDIKEVTRRAGQSKSRIYELMADGKFPKQVSIGGSSRWSSQEVIDWIEARKAERT